MRTDAAAGDTAALWGISSFGRARALQARGGEIEARMLHFWKGGQVVKAMVLKTIEPKSSGGSNPSPFVLKF